MPVNAGSDLPQSLDIDELETWAIRRALQQTGGNVSQAARLLGMSRDTLHTKLKKKGISYNAATQTLTLNFAQKTAVGKGFDVVVLTGGIVGADGQERAIRQ